MRAQRAAPEEPAWQRPEPILAQRLGAEEFGADSQKNPAPDPEVGRWKGTKREAPGEQFPSDGGYRLRSTGD